MPETEEGMSLETKLGIEINAYGLRRTVREILDELSPRDVTEVFEGVLAGLLQEEGDK